MSYSDGCLIYVTDLELRRIHGDPYMLSYTIKDVLKNLTFVFSMSVFQLKRFYFIS